MKQSYASAGKAPRRDKFVYDPNNKGAGKVAINATKAAYRFITGEQGKKNYEIKTPLCGPRGARDRVGDCRRSGQRKEQSRLGIDLHDAHGAAVSRASAAL